MLYKNKVNAVKDCRTKRKQELVKVGGEKCQICGYDKCIAALEFHHCYPKEKIYGLSSGNCHSLLSDLLEVQKCILLCSNCHREVEYNNIQLEPYIDKNNAEKIAEDNGYKIVWDKNKIIDLKKGTFCKQCGIKITHGANLCSKCYKESLCSVRPSREELKKLIRTTPFTKIGTMFNVTDNAVRKWCIKYNLPSKKQDIHLISNEDWIKI